MISLAERRVIVQEGAFVGEAMQAGLYQSTTGQLLRVTKGVAKGPLEVGYEAADGASKWGANDALYHLGDPEPTVAAYGDEGPESGDVGQRSR